MYEGLPQFAQHPVAGKDLRFVVPLSLHGDGTPIAGAGKSWSKMGDFFSWSSMLVSTGHCELVRFLIFCIHAHMRTKQAGHNTLDVVFEVMRWSLEALMSAKWPVLDWLGNKLDYTKRRIGKVWAPCVLCVCVSEASYGFLRTVFELCALMRSCFLCDTSPRVLIYLE